jgi:excisionase family DNA binding protein
MLSPAEVAALANVSRKTVYRETDRGVLPALHIGRQLRIDPSDFAITWGGARRRDRGRYEIQLRPRRAPDRD